MSKLGIRTPFVMNEIHSKVLLTGHKFMPKLLLRQPGFTYSACKLFTKHFERIQKFKAWFAHDPVHADSNSLAKRIGSDKILKDKAYEINTIYDGYQRGLSSMVYKFFHKKTGSGVLVKTKAGRNVNEVLAQELHKPMIKKILERKAYARFKDIIWAAD